VIVDGVYHQTDMVCWLPRDRYTRVQARHRFWRETNAAGWNVAWTSIRVVARFLHPFPHRHPDEGVFEQCDRETNGAVAVWRCETLGRNGHPMLPETSLLGKGS
jgi:hypothetical protein